MDGFSQNSCDEPPSAGGIPVNDATTQLTAHQAIANDQYSSSSFSEAVQAVTALTLQTFRQEIEQQQLYYHGIEHVEGVSRRAKLIFDVVVPFYERSCSTDAEAVTEMIGSDWNRQRELLNLSAIAHDMRQIFRPQTAPHTPRQRHSGESELATVEKLLSFLQEIDQKIDSSKQGAFTHFQPDDIQILEEAIKATICQYDANEGSIYQPWLYAEHRHGQPISLVARALALADIGTLGIDGIKAYNKEGMLLLLEENLDIIPFLQDETRFDDSFRENLRQRLLKRARFEISFAKGRLKRLDQELEGLPAGAIAQLKQTVFKHLTAETIQTLEALTPTAGNTPLAKLLDYFQLQPYVQAHIL